ncbi:MAG TPA: hypothetical protein VNA16_06830 [Abditibacteriaceae bacterium]|nr:hypothetical protein [Abditibacteriaceae bacterium]
MICSKCGYAMGAFDAECPRCHGKGTAQAGPQQPAPRPSQSTPARSVRGAVRFTLQSPEQIREEAERRIKSAIHARGNAGASLALKAGTLGLVLSFLCTYIPVTGALLARGLAICSVIYMVGSVGVFLFSRTRKVNEAELADLTDKLRNLAQGNCPICHEDILVSPIELVEVLECPRCRGDLYIRHGTVSPA